MYFLFDIGGTKMRFAVSDGDNGIDKNSIRIFDTPALFEEGIGNIEKVKKELGISKVKAVSGGIAGAFDKEKSKLISSPNMHDWIGKPLKGEIEKLFSAPTILNNDALVEGVGEANFGAGKSSKIVAYLTLGTGVGGVKIVDGVPEANAFGFEPGCQIISCFPSEGTDASKPCSCEGVANLEAYVSGTAIKKRYGKNGKELNEKELDEVTRILAIGLHNITIMWSPEIIVLGGGLMKDKVFRPSQLREYLEKLVKIFNNLPEIKVSTLGEFAGLYGALVLIKKAV